MGFTCGIVGLPNVGKSTIFSALSSAKAQAANFPFCTIEPNTGAVPVPDPRLKVLSDISKSEKIVPTQMTFVDIAGLIKGASKGEGLGNQFLGHIRSVDAILHVVRCFVDDEIIHVEGSVDPIRDIETIDMELLYSDLEATEKTLDKAKKTAKSGDKSLKDTVAFLESLTTHLGKGLPARDFPLDEDSDAFKKEVVKNLLTGKPVLFVANVEESDIARIPEEGGSHLIDRVYEHAMRMGSQVVIISGKVEGELSELNAEERKEFLDALGADQAGLDRLIYAGYKLLDLITFFTTGPKETHAWTAMRGSKAPQCAGKIHSDFEKGFIRAEVISYSDFVNAGGEVKAKELGKMRVEGKEYVTVDGDIVHFRFNV